MMEQILHEPPNKRHSNAVEPLCLWLVDDQECVLELASELLSKDGRIHCARQFPSAEAVLEALGESTPPDAILTDVNMGGITGIESIGPIKRRAPSTRVFIMTTFYDGVLAARARTAGAEGFFLKTGDWEQIAGQIANPIPAPRTECHSPLPVQEQEDGESISTFAKSARFPEKSINVNRGRRARTFSTRSYPPPWLIRVAAFVRAFI